MFSGTCLGDLYVSPSGSDSNPGTISQPLLTVTAARDAVRLLPKSSPINIILRAGTYNQSSTLVLGSTDSGADGNPVTYKAFTNETVNLIGGVALTNFLPVSDPTILSRLPAVSRASVLVSDLTPYGISDYGSLTNRGVSTDQGNNVVRRRPWQTELFYNGQRQLLSRWPNQDKTDEIFAWTTTPLAAGVTSNWFTYRESAPSSWQLSQDVWVHGAWKYDWADSYQLVTSIKSTTNTFITDTNGVYGYTSVNGQYEARNVLEELDLAGEWVLDRTNQLAYFYPPGANVNTLSFLSTLDGDIVDLTNVHNVYFQNINFQVARGSGIGMRNSSSNGVYGCRFYNLGQLGVTIGNAIWTNKMDLIPVDYDYQGGWSNTIQGCEFYGLNEGGVAMAGGNRTTLIPSGHIVTNCYFHSFNVGVWAYRPAVKLDGVGCRISHCTMQDSQHTAIWFQGNDHVIEYCNIFSVVKDGGDAGAIYSVARDWKQRGTIIRNNFIQPTEGNGIYLDDFTSGVTMQSNVIMCVNYPILVGGGKDNSFFNNMVIGGGRNNTIAWTVSNRGATWSTSSIPNLVTLLQQVDYTNPPYSSYTGMSTLASDVSTYLTTPNTHNLTNLGYATGNGIITNVFVSCKPDLSDIDTNLIAQSANTYSSSYTSFTGFTNSTPERARDFTLSNVSAPIVAGFGQTTTNNMGVHDDSYGVVMASSVPVYPPQPTRAPFWGTPYTIPGTLLVYAYDEGVNGDGFTNSNADRVWNNAWGNGRFRLTSEFYIWGQLVNGVRTYSMDMDNNDAVEWTVSVGNSGRFRVDATYDTYISTFILYMDGAAITSTLGPSTLTALVDLMVGSHTLKLKCNSNSSRLVSLTFSDYSTATATSVHVGNLHVTQ